MDIKLFKQILKEFENSTIHKLEISEKEFTVKMEKKPETTEIIKTIEPQQMVQKEAMIEASNDVIKHQFTPVESPLVGTYYDSPSPDSAPFIKVNQQVSEGDVLCIVEAMKVMNEIRSPMAGKIKKIHVQNETMVEYGQVLIEIEAV